MLRLFARLFGAALLSSVLASRPAHSESLPPAVDAADTAPLSADARYAATRVLDSADHRGRPFAIVDKRDAQLHLFDRSGQWLGSTPVLIGLTPGDADVNGIAGRRPASLAPHERSTPSGRFESVPGHNDKGEAIVWVDHAASLAIHRLRPAPAQERRAARLATPTPDDNRISLGCIVVPVAFYEARVEPVLGREPGVVYVLPETQPVQALFDAPPQRLATR